MAEFVSKWIGWVPQGGVAREQGSNTTESGANRRRGIPTRYKGRQYRSRLEARWAAFFDLLSWKYEYEPCDFEGWIPDFVLYEATTVYVEVKPVVTFPQEVAAKIDATSCEEEALIVGSTILKKMCGWWDSSYYLGWLREAPDGPSEGWVWGLAPLGQWIMKAGHLPRPGFCHDMHSFCDRITGGYDGGSHGGERLDTSRIEVAWAEAGNIVQWRAPRGA
jgi:hypothetical protein